MYVMTHHTVGSVDIGTRAKIRRGKVVLHIQTLKDFKMSYFLFLIFLRIKLLVYREMDECHFRASSLLFEYLTSLVRLFPHTHGCLRCAPILPHYPHLPPFPMAALIWRGDAENRIFIKSTNRPQDVFSFKFTLC
jgi:hypothetical protein